MPGPVQRQPASRTQHAPVTRFSPGAQSRTNTTQRTPQRKPVDSFDTGPRGVKGKPQIDGQGGPQYLELRKMIMDNPHLGETQREKLLAKLDSEAKSGGGPLTKALTTMKNQNLDARTVAALLTPTGSMDPAMMNAELQQVQSLLDSPGWKALSPEQRQQVGTYLSQFNSSHASWMVGEFAALLNDPVFSRVGEEAVASIIHYAAQGSGSLSDRADVIAGVIDVLSNPNDPFLTNNPDALRMVKSNPAGFVARVLTAAEDPAALATAKGGVGSSDYRWSDLVLGLFLEGSPTDQQAKDTDAPPNQQSEGSGAAESRGGETSSGIPSLPKPQ
jgi:hypothetical protein